jgi:serine-type D-Ala-D-Ala carboxypeptidase/endopeptidase (penicillin-binding protein 4)
MLYIRAKQFAFLVLAVVCICATAPPRIQSEIDTLNADPALKHGLWAFSVMTADSGKMIAANNPELCVMPASTMKILTTGAALGLLGTDYQYTTLIQYEGKFDSIKGIIHGNLYIQGSGDPSLGSAWFKKAGEESDFEKMGKTLLALGVKEIDGMIIGDASCFGDNPVPDGWQWSDLGQYYGAGTSGLAYKGNSVTLFFNSTKDSCTIDKIIPQLDDVVYRSYVRADALPAKKDEAYVYGAPYGKEYAVYGTIPAQKIGYKVEAANPDPAYTCATELKAILLAAGIQVKGEASTVRRLQIKGKLNSTQRNKIAEIKSPNLSEIVKLTNVQSDNTFAEQISRTLGLLKGEGGTTEAGVKVIRNYWQSLGVDVEALHMTDGSGLSRSNLVTTNIEASVLQKIYQQKWFSVFDKSLPVAGKNGSMTSLCKGTLAENNLRAKTGYINKARGYAGYVKTKSGKLLCFSLLANNYTCTANEMKKKLEKLLVAMADLE